MKQIFLFLMICVNCGTIYAQNVKDSLDLDAESALLMCMSMPPSSDSSKDKKHPLPSHFNFLNKYIINLPKGDKVGLNFIDTDGNKTNFEIFEYVHYDKNSKPMVRGIVKGIRFHNGDSGKCVRLHGIGLSTTDSLDYAPHGGISDILVEEDFYDYFYGLIYEDSNNKSLRLVRPGDHYEIGEDMREYRKAIRNNQQDK